MIPSRPKELNVIPKHYFEPRPQIMNNAVPLLLVILYTFSPQKKFEWILYET